MSDWRFLMPDQIAKRLADLPRLSRPLSATLSKGASNEPATLVCENPCRFTQCSYGWINCDIGRSYD
jgi:hypothetical protein